MAKAPVRTVENLHAHIDLGSFVALMKSCLELSNPEERFALRKEPVLFQITTDTARSLIEGKTRQRYYEVQSIAIKDDAIVVIITPEFEEVEGFNGNA
jgi:hypothetical protein